MTSLLSLEEWRRIIGWNPFLFWGLSNDTVPITAACPKLVTQYAWQGNDAAGRAEIEAAIESAESLLRNYLGYAVAPQFAEVAIPWPRYYDANRDRLANWDATGRWIAARLPFGYGQVQAIGVEALTEIDTVTVAGADLVFTDEDGDGLDDTFTITATVPAGTDADDLAVYFAAADRLDGEDAGERWRIRPVRATVSGVTATIIGRIWTIVRPVLYEGVSVAPLDPGDTTVNGPYAQSLVVYTRQPDPTGTTAATAQANVVWETTPCHGWWCCCDGCSSPTTDPAGSPRDPAALATAIARATVRDARMGLVGVGEAVYNATTGIWSAAPWGACREPDRLVVRVYAGEPLVDQAVAPWLQRTIARLAAAELGRPICACEQANRDLYHWQFDLSRSQGTSEVFAYVSADDLRNPFGHRRGHIFAWKQVRNQRLAPATAA